MPLSEHEQRILAQLEESLVRQDPGFAERVRSETVYRHAGRACKWSALGFVVGVAVVVVCYSRSVLLGFAGVAMMFSSAVVFERNLRRMGKAGWHDLTHRKGQERDGTSGPIESAVHDAREWLRTRFQRRDR